MDSLIPVLDSLQAVLGYVLYVSLTLLFLSLSVWGVLIVLVQMYKDLQSRLEE
jgi:hypothetical protein